MTDVMLKNLFSDTEVADISAYCTEAGISLYDAIRSFVLDGIY